MRHILRKGPDTLELNTLFVQPTRYCALNCKDCYVKEHVQENFHTHWKEQAKLINHFYYNNLNNKELWANQISIAIDNLPKSEVIENGDKRFHLIAFLRYLLLNLPDENEFEDREFPQVHITVFNHQTVAEYSAVGIENWERLSAISFSHMEQHGSAKEVYEFFRHIGVQINYNLTMNMLPNTDVIAYEADKIIQLNNFIGHINLVHPKRPMDGMVDIRDRQTMLNSLQYFNRLKALLPAEMHAKLSLDSCLTDVNTYTTQGWTCGSNVSKLTVWPDGRVSGCPYALHPDPNSPRGETAADILENMFRARDRKPSDFHSICTLPRVYNEIIPLRRSKSQESYS